MTGKLQNASNVIHVVADEIEDLTQLLSRLLEDAVRIGRADIVRCDQTAGDRAAIVIPGPTTHWSRCSKTGWRLADDLDLGGRPSTVMPKGRNFH